MQRAVLLAVCALGVVVGAGGCDESASDEPRSAGAREQTIGPEAKRGKGGAEAEAEEDEAKAEPEPPPPLDRETIAEAVGVDATDKDGVIRVGWVRDDVTVEVDGTDFPPAAGLGSWAAFKPTQDGAMVMGDTVVFQDEVDAAMDAAFAHDLEVTALHNHFFYDRPKVYFMHIGGRGEAESLAKGVGAVWEAIRAVREKRANPAGSFGEPGPQPGELDAAEIEEIVGAEPADKPGGVLKVSMPGRTAMGSVDVAGPMGVGSWAAFSGSMESAVMDGDFVMTAAQVQPVLRTLREQGVHVVALHNHMVGEDPPLYFTHFWGKGPAPELARAFRAAVDARRKASDAD